MIPVRSRSLPTLTPPLIDQKNRPAPTDTGSASAARSETSWADRPLILDDDNRPVVCQYNERIFCAIEEALTSSQVAFRIKRKIFVNAIEGGYVSELNGILDGIRSKGHKINLDYTDLSGLSLGKINREEAERRFQDQGLLFLLSLPCLDLSDVSAVRANFSHSYLLHIDLRGADLSGANFTCSTLALCTLIDANLYGATFDRTEFSMCRVEGMVTNDRGLLSKQVPSVRKISVKLDGVHTSRKQDLMTEALTLKPREKTCAGSGCIIS